MTRTPFWAEKSDLEVARLINLGLLLCDGISEQDAGFDTIVGLNDAGLAKVAAIIREIREGMRVSVDVGGARE
jgi:orotate phosphoribosyltransferase-like protein